MPNQYSDPSKSRLQFLKDSISIETDDCILWPFAEYDRGRGYGSVLFDGRMRRAHRVAYRLTASNYDETLCVLHRCDTPACYNPKHLYQGTQRKNAEDRESRNRGNHVKGDRVNTSKLTADKVRIIRMLDKIGIGHCTIGRIFGVNHSSVRSIVHRQHWKHID